MDFWREIFMALSRNKLRTFLTGFAISWGIFILIVLLAAGNGIINAIGEEFSDQSRNVYTLYWGETSKPFKGHGTNRAIYFNDKDIRFLETEAKHVDQVSPSSYFSGTAIFNDKSNNIFVNGVRPVFKDINNVKMLEGRFINVQDEKNSEKYIVIDKTLRDKLFGEGVSPLGQFIIINNMAFNVVGVCEAERHSDGGESYIPFSTLKSIKRISRYWRLSFKVKGENFPHIRTFHLDYRFCHAHFGHRGCEQHHAHHREGTHQRNRHPQGPRRQVALNLGLHRHRILDYHHHIRLYRDVAWHDCS